MSELKDRIPEASEGFGKLVMAPSSKADTYASEVGVIMALLGIGPRYFISDQSTFSDFGRDVDEYEELSRQLGVTVTKDDYVADIAEQLWARMEQTTALGEELRS